MDDLKKRERRRRRNAERASGAESAPATSVGRGRIMIVSGLQQYLSAAKHDTSRTLSA